MNRRSPPGRQGRLRSQVNGGLCCWGDCGRSSGASRKRACCQCSDNAGWQARSVGFQQEQRFQGWTASEWSDWISEPDGSAWCENKRWEADRIVDWMITNWGIATLTRGSGVIDIGGEPGWLAAACLQRGISATVVDPTWRITGKGHWTNNCEGLQPGNARFTAFSAEFDSRFVDEHRELVHNASAIVSLYGDEATWPSLEFAVESGKPCAVVPCNECERFFPDHNKTYDGYCEALLYEFQWRGGRMELVILDGVPFSRALLVQGPSGFGVSGLDDLGQGHSQQQLPMHEGSKAIQEWWGQQGFMTASKWEQLEKQQQRIRQQFADNSW
eukprot:TRINITY_DN64882_c0_g1_i1.p1 TRINITY_DN64882_c0_g1~~TRINITY_DN64882_c0_g1_i1.p1  ORF type:complete len:329 (-),score=59.17 TRINITY_DN64882_c0_g1_i1:98-1084(-)